MSVSQLKNPLEGLPELGVEDGVDEGVEAAVDVAKPRGEEEGRVPGHPRQLELDAHRVQDVAREERHPAHEEAH